MPFFSAPTKHKRKVREGGLALTTLGTIFSREGKGCDDGQANAGLVNAQGDMEVDKESTE